MTVKHKKFDNRMHGTDGYPYTVTIKWNSQSGYWWNEVCADVMEVFGLPGHRYHTKPTSHYMEFFFKSEKDADLCKILLSEKISC